MLSIDLDFQKFANHIEKVLGDKISRANEYSLKVLNRRTYVYAIVKVKIVFFGRKEKKKSYFNSEVERTCETCLD